MYGANTLGLSDIRAPLNYVASTPNVFINIHDAGVNLAGPWRCWLAGYYGTSADIPADPDNAINKPGLGCTGSGGMNLHFVNGEPKQITLWLLPFYRRRSGVDGYALRSA